MLNKDILDFDTDVCPDNGHLNYSGALKVTSWLGDYLEANYELTDYASNQSWRTDYERYYEYKIDKLKEQLSLPDYLVQLIDSDFEAELVYYKSGLLESERLMQLCRNANICPALNEIETENCAHIIVRSTRTEEIVDDIEFTCSNLENINIMEIYKVDD